MKDVSPYGFVRTLSRLDELLARSARTRPDAVALRLPDGDVTYGDLDRRTDDFVALLVGLGIQAGGSSGAGRGKADSPSAKRRSAQESGPVGAAAAGASTVGAVEARAGDRVAILAENGPGFVAAFYGAIRAGAVAVPVNTAVDARGLQHLLRDSGARALVVTRRFLRVAEEALGEGDPPPDLSFVIGETPLAGGPTTHVPWDPNAAPSPPDSSGAVPGPKAKGPSPETAPQPPAGSADGADPDTPAAIIYTSGSTGAPRGATLSHRNLLTNTGSILEYLRLGSDDRMLVVLPFYYVYGLSLLNTHLAVGASLILGTDLFFPNRAVDRMKSDHATGFAGVPSSFTVLLHRSRLRDDVPSSLRYVTQAGGAMAPELTRELIAGLPGVDVFVMYGATEASARLAYLPPDRLAEKLGSIGIAIPGVALVVLREDGSEVEVGETGELVARGENIMLGYWNAPEETAEVLGPEGLRTGDLARRDEEGFLYIVGRKKEMIKSGAHRISPKEIEERLVEHPDVIEAAVIGVADDLLGEAIVAFAILREGAEADERGLHKFLVGSLPEYKVPGRLVIRESLPKNESGKILKRELRAEIEKA